MKYLLTLAFLLLLIDFTVFAQPNYRRKHFTINGKKSLFSIQEKRIAIPNSLMRGKPSDVNTDTLVKLWRNILNTDTINYAYAVATDHQGNVYVTGATGSVETSFDFLTVKYSSDGLLQWSSRYNSGGTNDDQAYAITVDSQGNVYVTGRSHRGPTSYDYTTIKYNYDGSVQWIAIYAGQAGSDQPTAIAVDNSGNVIVTGMSRALAPSFGMDFATVKYDSNGVQKWVARYNGPTGSDDRPTALRVDDSGNIYVTGMSENGAMDYDYATIKYSASGERLWVARYNGSGDFFDMAFDLTLDRYGNVIVTGGSTGLDLSTDFVTVKYDSLGVQQWVARYTGPPEVDLDASSVVSDSEGNIYVTGNSAGTYFTLKYNSQGILQWETSHIGSDTPPIIRIDKTGDLFVAGSQIISTGNYDFLILHYNVSGELHQVITDDGGNNSIDVSEAFILDNDGNLILTGWGTNDAVLAYPSWWITFKYRQSNVSDVTRNNEVADVFELYQNYPNPFNQTTTIKFTIQISGFVSLKVYNLLGQEVAILVNMELENGQHKVVWNAENIPSGVYIYRLNAGNLIKSKRMLFLK